MIDDFCKISRNHQSENRESKKSNNRESDYSLVLNHIITDLWIFRKHTVNTSPYKFK